MTALVHPSGYEVCGVVSIRQLGRRGHGAGTCGEEGQEFVTGNAGGVALMHVGGSTVQEASRQTLATLIINRKWQLAPFEST